MKKALCGGVERMISETQTALLRLLQEGVEAREKKYRLERDALNAAKAVKSIPKFMLKRQRSYVRFLRRGLTQAKRDLDIFKAECREIEEEEA